MTKENENNMDINKNVKEINEDIINTLNVVDSLNERIFLLENKINDYNKMFNLTTNTVNYILASMLVYESYLQQFDFDLESIQREIDSVYFESFTKADKLDEKSEYSNTILKKINDKLREFQDKINSSK